MPTPVRNCSWQVPALLAGLAIFFYWKIIFTNHYMFPWDAATFFYPVFSFVHEQLRHFRIPFWDPYVMSGFPNIGDPEAQIFYPFNWLFVLLRPFRDLSYKLVELQLIVHFFLAGLFMFYLARSFVRSTAASLVSALLLMYSGAMVAHTEHLASIDAMAWFPLVFLLARRALLENSHFFSVSAGIIFGLQILVGHLQHTVYLGFLLFLYFAYEACFGPQRAQLWPRWIVSLSIIALTGAALAMVQLVPTGELGRLSVRSYLTYWDITGANEPHFLYTLFLPNYFGGLYGVRYWYPGDISFNYVFLTVPGCLFALLGLIETIRRRNFFWLGLVLLCIDLSIGRNGHFADVIYHTPIFNLFRNMAAFFDVANFALCLMAALGAHAVFSKALPALLQKHLPALLTLLLLLTAAAGLYYRLDESIHGWYHMLAILALVSVTLAASQRNRLTQSASQWTLVGLLVFELFFYNMNQVFNWSMDDPRKFISRNSVAFGSDVLQYLRSDQSGDYRVAGVAGSDWGGNGPNVWLVPSIYGWNPVALRRYQDYINAFNFTGDFAQPNGGLYDRFDSPMLDLLGAKYVLAIDDELKEVIERQPEKFEKVFSGRYNFMTVYRNKNFLSRVWFYPRARTLPDEAQLLALMSSRSFDGRRMLLFEKGDLTGENARFAEELATIPLDPHGIVAASHGHLSEEQYCPEPALVFDSWGARDGDFIRFDVPGPAQPGRYLLTMRYTASQPPWPPPELETEIENGTAKQHSGPSAVAGTHGTACFKSRTADLGTFDLAPGTNRLTIRSKGSSDIKIYSAWLIRVPDPLPDDATLSGTFSIDGYSDSAERISFTSHASRDGFVLLNEIYYPGWEARLDGKPVTILRADGIFRALRVPAGDHQLEFRFRPRFFALGAAVSLTTLAAYLLGAIYWRRLRKAQPAV